MTYSGGIERMTSHSEGETEKLAERLASRFPSDITLLLEGEMGAGKTVVVRGLARAWGVDAREIQSPTYALIHEHDGRLGHFVHVDLYRLDPEDVPALGLEELLQAPGLKAIEWPDRLPETPAGAYRLRIERRPDGSRALELSQT
ncbi:MAG: tRNA (adenosine(37)-N6)-threonylcarbamoyltransferase complex ATPase subunit type 1 TsaE [Acidobacteriota bacterium]